MRYICKEHGKIISILNYEPTVPSSVTVIPVSDEDYDRLRNKTHFFNFESDRIEEHPQTVLQDQKNKSDIEKVNNDMKLFLNESDWKILRHIREKALGLPTSMSESDYLSLEKQRHDAAGLIQKI